MPSSNWSWQGRVGNYWIILSKRANTLKSIQRELTSAFQEIASSLPVEVYPWSSWAFLSTYWIFFLWYMPNWFCPKGWALKPLNISLSSLNFVMIYLSFTISTLISFMAFFLPLTDKTNKIHSTLTQKYMNLIT